MDTITVRLSSCGSECCVYSLLYFLEAFWSHVNRTDFSNNPFCLNLGLSGTIRLPQATRNLLWGPLFLQSGEMERTIDPTGVQNSPILTFLW